MRKPKSRRGNGSAPRYLVNRHWEMVTPESAEHGDFAELGTDYENERMSLDDLRSEAEQLGPWEPSVWPGISRGMWWTQSEPSHDRAYFEKGEEVRRSLHVTRIDGKPLEGKALQLVHDTIMGKANGRVRNGKRRKAPRQKGTTPARKRKPFPAPKSSSARRILSAALRKDK